MGLRYRTDGQSSAGSFLDDGRHWGATAKARAMRVYNARTGDTGLGGEATEIKVRAERVAGQMLIAMRETGERRGRRGAESAMYPRVTLPELRSPG